MYRSTKGKNLTNQERIDKAIRDAIMVVQDNMVDGREKSHAIMRLEEGLLWTKARELI